MRDAADLRLRVRDLEYGDIKAATLTRGVEQVADMLTIEATAKWLRLNRAFPLQSGDECQFVIDGAVVMTGIVTAIPLGYTATDHSVQIMAKSRASAMVSSSYTGKPRTWREASLEQIVRDVAKPYGIAVNVSADTGEPFKKYGAGIGESSWSVIQRAITARGVWAVSRSDGSIDIVETGTKRYRTPIVGRGGLGTQNVLAGSREDRYEDRHSEVIVVGQSGRRANWSDDQATKGFASAVDPGVAGHRPLVIYEGSESAQSKLKARAEWEVRRRAGDSRALSYTLLGWAEFDVGQPLWEPNRIVRVDDPLLDARGDFLISEVVTSFGDGTTATLTCVAPETYQRDAPVPMARHEMQPRDSNGRWSPWA